MGVSIIKKCLFSTDGLLHEKMFGISMRLKFRKQNHFLLTLKLYSEWLFIDSDSFLTVNLKVSSCHGRLKETDVYDLTIKQFSIYFHSSK